MRILIVKLSAIGDVVHTLPAVAWLKRTVPQAHITWAVSPKASAILQGSTVIDDLIEIDAVALNHNPFLKSNHAIEQDGNHSSGQQAGDPGFDIAIDFQGLLKSGLVLRASKAPRRVGFETTELREKLSRVFLTEQVETATIAHVIDKNLALAHAATNSTVEHHRAIDYEFPFAISREDEQAVLDRAFNLSERFAILNPGGGWVTKLWNPKNFGAVADWLWEAYQMTSLVTYGPGEKPLAESVAQSSQTRKAIPFPSTLKQFAALARRAEIFIGGDTGPLHLAAACRTPIVGLYGPTSPERNGPFSKEDLTIGLDLWCREKCHKRKCWHWRCMDISLNNVLAAVRERLNRVSQAAESTHQPLVFKV
jgi:lipopolysaccharide heptosyltransferase I